jgi:hypothetical protein
VEDGGFIDQINGGETPYVESERGTRYTLVYSDDDGEDPDIMSALAEWVS